MSNSISEAVKRVVIKYVQPGSWWKWTWTPRPDDGEYEIVAFVYCAGYSETGEDVVKFDQWLLEYAYQDMRPPGVGRDDEGITFRRFYDAVRSGQLTQVTEVPRFFPLDDDYEVVRKALMGFVSDHRKVVTVQEVLDACSEDFGVNKLLSILYGMKDNNVLVCNQVFLDNATELSFTSGGREVLRDPNRR